MRGFTSTYDFGFVCLYANMVLDGFPQSHGSLSHAENETFMVPQNRVNPLDSMAINQQNTSSDDSTLMANLGTAQTLFFTNRVNCMDSYEAEP